MSVYVFIEARVRDHQKFNDFIDAFSGITANYGARFLVRCGRVAPLGEGAETERRQPGRMIILEFPSEVNLRRCFASPEYRSLTPLRHEGAETRALMLEGFKPENL